MFPQVRTRPAGCAAGWGRLQVLWHRGCGGNLARYAAISITYCSTSLTTPYAKLALTQESLLLIIKSHLPWYFMIRRLQMVAYSGQSRTDITPCLLDGLPRGCFASRNQGARYDQYDSLESTLHSSSPGIDRTGCHDAINLLPATPGKASSSPFVP